MKLFEYTMRKKIFRSSPNVAFNDYCHNAVILCLLSCEFGSGSGTCDSAPGVALRLCAGLLQGCCRRKKRNGPTVVIRNAENAEEFVIGWTHSGGRTSP